MTRYESFALNVKKKVIFGSFALGLKKCKKLQALFDFFLQFISVKKRCVCACLYKKENEIIKNEIFLSFRGKRLKNVE